MQEAALLEVLLRDTFAGSTFLISFALAMMTWTLLKKSHGRFSTTSGLAAYFFGFLVYTVSVDFTLLYRDYLDDVFFEASILELLGGTVWVLGINLFILTVDTEMASLAAKRRVVSVLSGTYTSSFIIFILLGLEPYLIFIGLAVILLYESWQYLRTLLQLEAARRRFPQLMFVLAFNLSGFANFLILVSYSHFGFLAKNVLILAGVLVLLRVWTELPTAEDLNWLLTLDRLLVVEPESSVPLIDFRFRALDQENNNGSNPFGDDGAIVAGAVGGIDRLMDEILADTAGIGEIVHGKKTVMFLRRELFTCMLVTDKSMQETRYRMETFAVNFEEHYREELSSFTGDVTKFSKADALIRAAFY